MPGINQIYVHVNKDNIAAQRLYDQIGFQVRDPSCAPHGYLDPACLCLPLGNSFSFLLKKK